MDIIFFPDQDCFKILQFALGQVPQLGGHGFLGCIDHTNSVNLCKNTEILLISNEICVEPLCEIGELEDFFWF